jgi:SRSO17 transposase
LSGGVAARACNAAASWRFGSGRPESPHAGWHERPTRSCRCAGCWPEWPVGKAEPTKYWLSNLPEATPLVELVRLARLRWRVEQDYRELKGAFGLDHFEGRGFLGWHHHVTLVSVAHGFLTLERLRSPKSSGVGLSLWQLLGELQVLLACWAGACPVCKRPAPRWLRPTGRPPAPT